MSSAETFLEVQNLKTHFPVEKGLLFRRRLGDVKAVDGVSFRCVRAKSSDWWAKAAAANPPWGGPSCNWSGPPPALSFWKADH